MTVGARRNLRGATAAALDAGYGLRAAIRVGATIARIAQVVTADPETEYENDAGYAPGVDLARPMVAGFALDEATYILTVATALWAKGAN